MGDSLRRPLIAGNWKMNLDLQGAVGLARGLSAALPMGGRHGAPAANATPEGGRYGAPAGASAAPAADFGPEGGRHGAPAGASAVPEVLVAPPFTALTVVAEVLKGGPIRLGAQDLHWADSGAFTGEVSAGQLKDAGCAAVIIGHSERRRHFGETDDRVRRKLGAALKTGLTPIVCIGETLEERESQRTWRVLETQLTGALSDCAPVASLGRPQKSGLSESRP